MHSAVVAHEYKHKDDWVGMYQPELQGAIAFAESISVVIDCDCWWTIHCSSVLLDWEADIWIAFQEAYISACEQFDNPSTPLDESEQRAYLVSSGINHPVSNALPGGCGP